ncbi:MAG: hypothetical protein ACXABY_11670 [Candidatus Thorarchaeota archaeon]
MTKTMRKRKTKKAMRRKRRKRRSSQERRHYHKKLVKLALRNGTKFNVSELIKRGRHDVQSE